MKAIHWRIKKIEQLNQKVNQKVNQTYFYKSRSKVKVKVKVKSRVVDKIFFELGNYSHNFQQLGIQNIDWVPLPTFFLVIG